MIRESLELELTHLVDMQSAANSARVNLALRFKSLEPESQDVCKPSYMEIENHLTDLMGKLQSRVAELLKSE